MRKLFTCVVLCWMLTFVNTQCPPCSRGEKCHKPKEGEHLCIMCEDGEYMPFGNHTSRQCLPCTEIVNPDLEELVIKCSRFHDAVILCRKGRFRDRAKSVTQRDVCKNCTQCEFPERECQIYSDTVCCDPKKEANTTEAGLAVCKKKSILCGHGEFFSTLTGKCEPCPPGTSMPHNNHTNKDCLQCEGLSNDSVTHAIIVRPCSRTAPTLFGCEKGYFRDPTQESTQTEVPCTPCRDCSRSLIDCGMFQDAVCDVDDLRTSTDPVTSTQSTGSTENTEKGATESAEKGNSLRNDTSDKQDREQAENGETKFQKSVSCNITLYVAIATIIVILMFLLYILFCVKRHNEHYGLDGCNIASMCSRKFTTIIVVAVYTSIVALVFCVLVLAGTIPVSDRFNAAFVGGTIALAGLISIIALLHLSWGEHREPNKPYGKETCTRNMQLNDLDELVKLRIDETRDTDVDIHS